MRIGTLLISEGLVSAEQVQECLQAQVVEGARLGTNLVERKYIELDALSEALARQHGMAAATSKHFANADPALQALLDPSVAARWHCVPLGYISRDPVQIAVVTTDPLPNAGIGALQAALDGTIVPAIAPELRVLYHLEQAYGIPRLNRFRRVRGLRDDDLPPVDDNEAKARERRAYVRPVSEAGVEAPNALARVAIRKMVINTGEVATLDDIHCVDDARRAMRRARSRDALGHAVAAGLASLHPELEVGMALVFRRGMVIGWKGFVRDGADHLVEGVAIPLSEPSVFNSLREFQSPISGRPAAEKLDCALWQALKTGAPAEWVVAPVIYNHKPVAALYIHCTSPIPDGVEGGVLVLANSLAAGFKRLINAAKR